MTSLHALDSYGGVLQAVCMCCAALYRCLRRMPHMTHILCPADALSACKFAPIASALNRHLWLQSFPTAQLQHSSYEKKRHQAGRAFEAAGLQSVAYAFMRRIELPRQQCGLCPSQSGPSTSCASKPAQGYSAAHNSEQCPLASSAHHALPSAQQQHSLRLLRRDQWPPWLWQWTAEELHTMLVERADIHMQASSFTCSHCNRCDARPHPQGMVHVNAA